MRRILPVLLVLLWTGAVYAMEIKSDVFKDGGYIPRDYTCQGKNISPALSWKDVPAGTKSFVLICDDPDAPMGDWVHWVIFNIPAGLTGFADNVSQSADLAKDTIEGKNDFGNNSYGGPCPPPGKPHRYFFKLYALDTEKLTLGANATKKDLLEAMEGHIIAQAKVIGMYKR